MLSPDQLAALSVPAPAVANGAAVSSPAPAPAAAVPVPGAAAVGNGAVGVGAGTAALPPPAPPVALGISPQDFQRSQLAGVAQQGDINLANNAVDAEDAAKKLAVRDQQVRDKTQAIADTKSRYDALKQKFDLEHSQIQKAYDASVAATKDEKDPSERFWGNKNAGQKILSAFALVLGGAGGGLMKSGHNAVLDQIQHQIDQNFEEHRDHIKDLYDNQVAAGKIADSSQAEAEFMEKAYLHLNDLADQQVASQLDQISANSTNARVPLLAKQIILDRTQKTDALKHTWFATQAAAGAAQAAQQRKAAEDTRKDYFAALHNHNDLGEDQARVAAFNDMLAAGYPQSYLAPSAQALGVPYDTKTGRFDTSAIEGAKPAPVTDENGNPTRDPVTGKLYTPDQRLAMKRDQDEKTVLVDGKPQVAVSKPAAEAWQKFGDSYVNIRANKQKLLDAWQRGDKGAYEQARGVLEEEMPKLYGFTRGPSEGQLGGAAQEGGTVGEQIPKFDLLDRAAVTNLHGKPIVGPRVINDKKLQAFSDDIDKHLQTAKDNTFAPTPTSATPAKPKIDFTPSK